MTTSSRLLMNRAQFDDLNIDAIEAPKAQAGEVVLALDRFSLTINNVTYAAFGEALRYWDFFPTGVEGQGLLPVWGYADVVDSAVEGIESGQRYFGYFPCASHLVVVPGKTGDRSFRDESAHRKELPEVYNWYQRTDNDPFQTEPVEPLHAIFRPLFVTAFGLADHLAEQNFFGAEQVVISSASSRTGYSEAFSIQQHSDIDIIGLTSERNRDFVKRLGLYAKAVAYEEVETLDASKATLFIDVAGNADIQLRIHQHFGDKLVHDTALGAAHSHEPTQSDPNLPGPKPIFFFAPEWVAKRQQEWGSDGFNQRVGEAVARFLKHVTEQQLIQVREQPGFEAAKRVLIELLEGRTDPAIGHVIRLRGE
ncbi:MAG: DUF2855 family protein [Pseudomonadota bacterium]